MTAPSAICTNHHPSETEQVREQERQRIARDLHDELGSQLTGIKMALAQLRQQLLSSATSTALTTQAAYADQLVDAAIEAMHHIIDDLHPPILELGLPTALQWLALSLSRQTGIPHQLQLSTPEPLLLNSFSTVSLYRIAREALHNVAQHAAASSVRISLRQDSAALLLEISDDGIGLPAAVSDAACASGLRGMQARAAAIGGCLQLGTGSSGGLQLQVRVPMTVT